MAMTDRSQLASRTRTLQIGAAALFFAGGAVAVGGIPFVRTPDVPVIDIGPETIAPPVAATTTPMNSNVDFEGIADRLGMLSNRPVQPVVETAAVTGEPKATEVPVATTVDHGKFLGTVKMGAVTMGLLSKEDKQSFVKVGDKLGDFTVTHITPTQLTLASNNGADAILDLAPKGSDMVTRTSSSAGGGAFNGAGVQRNTVVRGTTGIPNNAATLAAQRAAAARQQVQLNKGTTFTPASMPNFNAMQNYGHIMNDPARRARFTEIQNKLRSSGEFKSQIDIDEAAAKMTEEEHNASMNSAPAKGVK